MAAAEASRSRSRRSTLLSVEKNPDSPQGRRIRSDPCRFSVAKTKKARQILADLSGYLAKPNQRHWWFGKKTTTRILFSRRSQE
jgi:hypothetical protein